MGGASSQESSQQSGGWSLGRSNSFSGSGNRSFGRNVSQSGSLTDTFVDPAQAGFLQQLRSMGMNFTNPAQMVQAATAAQQDVMPGLQQGFQNVASLTDASGQIEAQSAALQSGLGNLFRTEINPAIQGNSIGAGGFGGGRQGVAEGVATGELADSYTAGVGDITARANAQAAQAGSMLPGIAQSIFGAATAPQMAAFDPLMQMSQILGGPTVLQRSRADSASRGISRSRGRSRSRSASANYGSQQSSGSSSGWDFNVLDFL